MVNPVLKIGARVRGVKNTCGRHVGAFGVVVGQEGTSRKRKLRVRWDDGSESLQHARSVTAASGVPVLGNDAPFAAVVPSSSGTTPRSSSSSSSSSSQQVPQRRTLPPRERKQVDFVAVIADASDSEDEGREPDDDPDFSDGADADDEDAGDGDASDAELNALLDGVMDDVQQPQPRARETKQATPSLIVHGQEWEDVDTTFNMASEGIPQVHTGAPDIKWKPLCGIDERERSEYTYFLQFFPTTMLESIVSSTNAGLQGANRKLRPQRSSWCTLVSCTPPRSTGVSRCATCGGHHQREPSISHRRLGSARVCPRTGSMK